MVPFPVIGLETATCTLLFKPPLVISSEIRAPILIPSGLPEVPLPVIGLETAAPWK